MPPSVPVPPGSGKASGPPGLEVVLAAHGEAETTGLLEQCRVGSRTLAHAARVMTLPAPLRLVISLLAALRKRRARGAGSPHNAWTRAQAEALAPKLEALLGEPVSVQAAFASSDPGVEDIIARPSGAGRRILVSMMPSDSRLACGLLCHALAGAGEPPGRTRVLARLGDDPAFIAVNAAHVKQACAAWSERTAPGGRGSAALVLAFHGTLVRDRGGRPPTFHAGLAEKTRFAEALRIALSSDPDAPWSEVIPAYLNHDVGGTWTSPTVAEVLDQLGRRGVTRVWVFPCDYLVEGGEVSGGLAASLAAGPIPDARLLPCLNDAPAFIDYLALRVQRALAHPEGPWTCDVCPRPAGDRVPRSMPAPPSE